MSNTNTKELFKKTVKTRLDLHPNQWTGEDSAEVVRTLLTNLKDDQGNEIVLTEGEKEIIQLASRPTNDVQVRVIKRIADAHNVKLDADTEKCIKKVVTPTGFKMDLIKKGHIKDTSSDDLLD